MLMMSTAGRPRDPRARRDLARSRSRATAWPPARSATSSPASRTSARPGSATPSPAPANPAEEALAGYDHPKPMVFSGLYPVDGDEYPELRDALDKLRLNDAALVYEPETSHRARLRLPLRLPRPAAHGDRPRAAGARVRPVPHLHRAERRLPRRHGKRPGAPGDQPERLPRRHRRLRRTPGPRATPAARSRKSTSRSCGPRSSRRPTTSARSWSCARAGAASLHRHGLPVHRPGGDPLHDAARRDHLRLLRPAQVPDPGLRDASTTSPTASSRPTWSRSTSCCRASRWTRSARSCTPTTPASTACR